MITVKMFSDIVDNELMDEVGRIEEGIDKQLSNITYNRSYDKEGIQLTVDCFGYDEDVVDKTLQMYIIEGNWYKVYWECHYVRDEKGQDTHYVESATVVLCWKSSQTSEFAESLPYQVERGVNVSSHFDIDKFEVRQE